MNSRQKNLLLIFFALTFFILLFIFRVKKDMVDFEVNYKAGKRLQMAETLYRVEDGHYMFKYLPSSAFLYIPLSLLPLNTAKTIWYFTTIFCSLCLFYISYKLIPLEKRKNSYMLIFPAIILAKFFFREIDLGQINTLVITILLVMIWIMSHPKNTTSSQNQTYAGLLWGFSIALKPYSVIFLPYFIVRKKWKSLLSGFCFLLFALFIPVIYYGFQGNIIVLKEWFSTLSQSTPNLFTTWDNISIIAFFMKWSGNQILSIVLYGITIGLIAFILLFIILKGKNVTTPYVLECSILLILVPLVSPLGWDYNLLMSILGIMLIIFNFSSFPKFWRIILIINFSIISLSIYDIIGRDLYGKFMSLSILTINFLIITGYLMYLRFRNSC